MEAKEVHNPGMLVDLEKGDCLLTREKNNKMDVKSVAGHGGTMPEGSWNNAESRKDDRSHHVSCYSSHCRDSFAKNGEPMSSDEKMNGGVSDNSVGDKEKKKNRFKKPPRPPRPTTTPLDPADKKLTSELSELAVLKSTRIERMKALKKMKNSKPGSSIENLVALIITVVFCFFILWQGVFSKAQGELQLHGPSILLIRTHVTLEWGQDWRSMAKLEWLQNEWWLGTNCHYDCRRSFMLLLVVLMLQPITVCPRFMLPGLVKG